MCNTISLKFTTKNLIFQQFPFPASFIASVFFNKNPKFSHLLFYKLYFTCKIFYSKLKIIPVLGLNFEDNSTLRLIYDKQSSFLVPDSEILKFDFKFFVSYQICDVKMQPNPITTTMKLLLPNIVRCEIICLAISHCKLTLKEFRMLTTTVACLSVSRIAVEDQKGFVNPIEDLLFYVPRCSSLDFSPCHESIQYGYTNKTAEKLVLLEFTRKMHSLFLLDVPQTFNADAFALFIKKNANHGSTFRIKFQDNVESVFKAAFQTRVIASLSSWNSEAQNLTLRIL